MSERRQVVMLLQHPVFVRVNENPRCVVIEAKEPIPKFLPGTESLPRPYPHARRKAYCERHEVLQKQHHMERFEVVFIQLLAAWTHDTLHVFVIDVALIHETTDNYRRRQSRKHTEDPNTNHELFKLVRLCPVVDSTLVLDHITNAEQRNKPAEQEDNAKNQIDDERVYDEILEIVDVMIAHVANASNGVTIHSAHDDHTHTLHCGYQPCGQVEVQGVGSNGLVTPLESRGQEPGEGENHPPDVGGHAEEVNKEEDERAGRGT